MSSHRRYHDIDKCHVDPETFSEKSIKRGPMDRITRQECLFLAPQVFYEGR